MDPAPPLNIDEDPWFATRISFGVAATYVMAMIFDVTMALLPAVLISSLMATARGAIDLRRVIGAGVMIPVVVHVFTWLVQATRGEMLVFLVVMTALTYFAMLFVMKTGQRMGLLLLIFPHMLGMMGVTSDVAMLAVRDSFVAAGLISLIVIPVSYLLFPPRAREPWKEVPAPPGFAKPWLEALIRTIAAMPVLVAFYLWVDPSNLIYAVMVIIVLAYPQRHQQRREAAGRLVATATGGAMAVAVTGLVALQPTLPVILLSLFLGCLWFAWRITSDPERRYTHQIAMTVFISVALGAVTGTDPFTGGLQRLALTLGGVSFALLAMAGLRWLFARETFFDTYRPRNAEA